MHDSGSSTGLSPQVAAPLAYAGWWITGAVIWFVERRDAYVRFHAAQAVTTFGLISLLIVTFGALAVASLTFMPGAFGPFLWATVVTGAAGVVLWAVSIGQVVRGRAWRLPLAGTLAARWSGVDGAS